MLIREEDRYRIIGAAMEVHRELGRGFNEYVYQDALEHEFKLRAIPYEREKRILARYKGLTLPHAFQLDFVCFGDIIVECKAVSALTDIHESQVHNYVNISGFPLGLLINFGEDSLKRKVLFNKNLKHKA